MLRELSSEWKTLIKKFEWEIWRERKFSFSSLCHIIIFLCWLGPDHHRDRWGKNYKFVIFDPRLHWDFAAQICWVCGVVGINHKTRKKVTQLVIIWSHFCLLSSSSSIFILSQGKWVEKIYNFSSSIFMVVLLLLHFLAMLASSNTTLPPIINTRNYYIVLLEGSSMSSRTWLWRFSGGYESVFVMPRRVWGIS